MIVGLSGKIATGKTTAANYLHDSHGFTILSTRDLLTGILEAKKQETSRKNLQDVGEEFISLVGGGGFVAIMLQYLPEGDYVIDAIRYVEAIDYLRSKYGRRFHQIYVKADDKVRYARMKQKADLGNKLAEYKKIDEAPTETDRNLEDKSDSKIMNESTFQVFYSSLDKIHSATSR